MMMTPLSGEVVLELKDPRRRHKKWKELRKDACVEEQGVGPWTVRGEGC